MKTMKRQQEIVRVTERMVSSYEAAGYEFCSKEEWKEKVRDGDNTTGKG